MNSACVIGAGFIFIIVCHVLGERSGDGQKTVFMKCGMGDAPLFPYRTLYASD